MKSLGISLGIVLGLSLVLFAMIHAFGVGSSVAGPLASSAFGSITFIHDQVDKALSASGKSPVTPGIVPVNYFKISSPLMLLYVSLISIAMVEATSLPSAWLVEFAFKATGETPSLQSMNILSAWMTLPILGFCLFALGRWVGVRSAAAGYWILPAGFVIGRILDLFGIYLLYPASWKVLSVAFQSALGIASIAGILSIIVGIGLVGVWRGDRSRFGSYFNSLLRQVSGPTRDTLLQMAFEEARQSKSGVGGTV
jgi:hypothetical protein